MHWVKTIVQYASRSILLRSVFLFAAASALAQESEQKLEVLQIGTQTYSNVTVTTKAKTYVMFLHSAGVASIKVADLSPDARNQLGYVEEKPKVRTNSPAIWAKQTLARMDTPQVKEVKRKVEEQWRAYFPNGVPKLPRNDLGTLGIVVGILLLIHLIWSYCYAQICKKAGTQPGVLVWLPILQFISLLRAARMSGWWFLALFVPLLNVVIGIVWCFKIATARGKSALVGLLLLLPITNLFAFLYLVFSDGAPDQAPRREKRANGTISLQTT